LSEFVVDVQIDTIITAITGNVYLL